MGEITIKHSLNKSKFLAMDDEIQAGYLDYNLKDKTIYILSIFIDPNYRNQSLAQKLLNNCVDHVRKEDFKIIPICSYAAKVFEKSDKYDDVKVI